MQQLFKFLFVVALSLSVASAQTQQEGYILAEFYENGGCTGDVLYQLFSSFDCIADLDGDNQYFKFTYNNASMSIGFFECDYSDCTGCNPQQTYVSGLCYAGWSYSWIDNIVEDKVGVFYYSDSNCQDIQAAETYRDNECIDEGTDSYLYQCDETGQAQLTYCDSTGCNTNCVTFPYPAICSLDSDSGYYTEVKCDAGNLTVNLMLAAVVLVSTFLL